MPLFLDLGSRSVVIFGGGKVGERKARLFSDYSRVIVVSRTFTDGLKQMEKDESVKLIQADLSCGCDQCDQYLKGAFIVIPATNDARLNQYIDRRASEMGIMVNRVDGVGDVVVPSIIRKGPISIAISTESPALSKYLRIRLESELQENFEEMARLLSQIRKDLKLAVPDQKARSKIVWSILADREIWKLLDQSYEKAYMRAREQVPQDERDSLNASDSPQGVHKRD